MGLSRYLLRPFIHRIPGQLVIQFTDRCNAKCPQCGMRVTEQFPRATLEMDDVKRALDHAARTGIRAVSFTGGEPFLHFDELIQLIHYAGGLGIKYIRTGTNAFQLWRALGPGFEGEVASLADRLAATPLRNLWISLDSADPEVHERMRGFPGIFEAIERALPIFHERGIYPSANLGINRNVGGEDTQNLRLDGATDCEEQRLRFTDGYRAAFHRFYRRVLDMGFTTVNACYPMSMESLPSTNAMSAVYAATSADSIVRYSALEKSLLYATLAEVIPEYRSRVRIFSPLCSLHALAREHAGHKDTSYPCRGGIDFFFIDSHDGNAYPCGYRGAESLGKFWQVDRAAIDRRYACRLCDWECFRDPAEMGGPLSQMLANPFALVGRFRRDSQFFRLWLEDWRYYRACGFFDGRRPPQAERLARFAPKSREVNGELIEA